MDANGRWFENSLEPGDVSVRVVNDATSSESSRWKTFGERVIYDPNPQVERRRLSTAG
jgi:hypothetical protein